DLLGNLAHFHRIGADHAELHGEAHWWTEHETIHPRPRFRQRPLVEGFFEPGLDALAGFEVFGDDDDLSKIRVWQHRIEPNPKARRAPAGPVGVGDTRGVSPQRGS